MLGITSRKAENLGETGKGKAEVAGRHGGGNQATGEGT